MPDTDDFIRPTDSSSAVPFQFEDVRVMAAKVLRTAAQQAERKLEAAQKQAKDIEEAGYADGFEKGQKEGYQAGLEEGRVAGSAEAKTEFVDATKGVQPALEAVLQELESRKIELQAQAESDLLELSLAIARRIIRHAIEIDPERIIPIVNEAIALTTARSDLVIRVCPEDMMALEKELAHLRTAFTDLGKVHIESDDSIHPGGVVVTGRDGEIDMRIEEQFSVLEEALTGSARQKSSESDADGGIVAGQ